MPHLIPIHTIRGKSRITQKAVKRAETRSMLKKAANAVDTTYHGEQRLKERFRLRDDKAKMDMIGGIAAGRVKYNEKYKTYKVKGNKGYYILSLDCKIITAYVVNTGSVLEYKPVPHNERQEMLKKIGVNFNL